METMLEEFLRDAEEFQAERHGKHWDEMSLREQNTALHHFLMVSTEFQEIQDPPSDVKSRTRFFLKWARDRMSQAEKLTAYHTPEPALYTFSEMSDEEYRELLRERYGLDDED